MMKLVLETDKNAKGYKTVFSNEQFVIVVKVHDGKALPHDKYSFSLLEASLVRPSVSMAAAKITSFALYTPELNMTDIQAALWMKVWDDITDTASLLVPSSVSFIF